MKLTSFTDYSLRVLIYLGLQDGKRVTIREISDAYCISRNHLMKVVSNLTRAQIVVAQRGPGGGIKLNRAPQDIRLNDIISITEKHLQNLGDSEPSGDHALTADTRLGNYLNLALQAYLDALGEFTLADVLELPTEAVQLLKLKEIAA